MRAWWLAVLLWPATVEASFHPAIPLLDDAGRPVLESGGAVSPATTCGGCHDVDFILAHDAHAAPVVDTAWRRVSDAVDGNCFVCHLESPDDAARRAEWDAGRPEWAATATLAATDLVRGGTGGWVWDPGAFDAEGRARSLALVDPTSAACGACHGHVQLDLDQPLRLPEDPAAAARTFLTGGIFAAQPVRESALDLRGKDALDHPWDIHAARGVGCVDCHPAANNPVFQRASERPAHLRVDVRRLALGDYLERPDHRLGVPADRVDPGSTAQGCETCHDARATHGWLPYADRHLATLACNACHTPFQRTPTVRRVVDGRVELAGAEPPWPATTPALLPAHDGETVRLAPFRIRVEWEGDRGEVVASPVAHGVVGGDHALRECTACHGPDTRVAARIDLGPGPSGGQAVLREDPRLAGGLSLAEGAGGWTLSVHADQAGFWVLGHDAHVWAGRLGLGVVSLVCLGILLHGGFRWILLRRRPAFVASGRAYLYSRYERLWHWLQALAVLVLMATGLEIHFPTRVPFLGFETAVRLHNVVGFVVVANAFLSAFYHLATGEIRQYLPTRRGFFADANTQARFYLRGLFRREPHPFDKTPECKLNPLQQITYMAILNVLLPLQVVTGILLWGAPRWPGLEAAVGGLGVLATVHGLGSWLFAAFLLMHIYLTTTGSTATSNLRAMVTGWEETEATPSPETTS